MKKAGIVMLIYYMLINLLELVLVKEKYKTLSEMNNKLLLTLWNF